jgi:hypothetical protein
MGATSGAGSTDPSEIHEITQVFTGTRVTRLFSLYISFVDRCFSFCTFSFRHS